MSFHSAPWFVFVYSLKNCCLSNKVQDSNGFQCADLSLYFWMLFVQTLAKTGNYVFVFVSNVYESCFSVFPARVSR